MQIDAECNAKMSRIAIALCDEGKSDFIIPAESEKRNQNEIIHKYMCIASDGAIDLLFKYHFDKPQARINSI